MGCLNAFIREFRQRLIDIRWQAWDDRVNTSDRFKVYNVDELKCPLCLSAVDNEAHFVLCCPAFDANL